ncbi:ATP-binding protein [Streptomyces sp. NPDC008313]|uniref:ATP-binding protein n=1 Tax=Streptomyces sp. NPDC008313 TaxID=3364826 RepID=UPI0036ED48B3
MVSVQSPPGGRELSSARVLVLPAVLMAVATGAAVALVTEPARTAVGWCGAVATLLVVATAAEAVRRARIVRALRAEHHRRSTQLEQRVAGHDQEIVRLGKEVVPVALNRMRRGLSPQEALQETIACEPAYQGLPASQRDIVRTVLEIVDHEQMLRDSGQRAFVHIARRVQAIVHQQAKELREMEEDHGRNPEVFDDLLRIDHGTALIGRLADSIAVLGGGRPGRQWPQPVPLFSVLRGAMSRILEYRRVELHSIAEVSVGGLSVEPVIHACAELLDNATRYSPPQTRVHVTAVEVQTGIAIEIEDGGVSLSEEGRAKAEGMLAAAQAGVEVNDLGDAPRLGLAVVGRLTKMFDMQISLRQSAYGGVRAVLIVPHAMLTTGPGAGLAHGVGASSVPSMDTGGVEGPKRVPKKRRPTTGPRVPAPAGGSLDDDVPEVTEWTPNGLPQRRSRVKTPLSQRIAEARAAEAAQEAARAAAPAWASEPVPEKKEPEPGLWVEAFMKGLKGDPDPAAATGTTDRPARVEADDEGDLT